MGDVVCFKHEWERYELRDVPWGPPTYIGYRCRICGEPGYEVPSEL